VQNLRFTQSFIGALGAGNVLGVGRDTRFSGTTIVPALHLASWNFTGGGQG
jgi:hypothetical protein